MMTEILGILIAALLSQNFILVKFYGICPFMGVSKKIDTALGMGMAVTFVMALASAACFAINLVLIALGLEYMQTVAFILVIATLVQVVEMFLKKFVPALYKALGVFLPLITTNCAVLGVVLVNVQNGYNFLIKSRTIFFLKNKIENQHFLWRKYSMPNTRYVCLIKLLDLILY